MSTSIDLVVVKPFYTPESVNAPEKNESNSFVELSKHSCMNVITVFRSPTAGDSLETSEWPILSRFSRKNGSVFD